MESTSSLPELKIIDTGDNYILALDGNGYSDALTLYKEMEFTVNEISTGYRLNKDSSDFIFESIGKVISYGFGCTEVSISANDSIMNTTDIPKKIIEDVQKALDFYKIKSYWGSIHLPTNPISSFSDRIKGTLIIDECQTMLNPFLDFKINQNNVYGQALKLYVVFNTLYNLSLVISGHTLSCSINNLVSAFPDFELAFEIYLIHIGIESNRESFYNVFHKKSFESIGEIKKKFTSFKDLYNICDDNNDTSNRNKEKERVNKYFQWNYTITNDIDKRCKANDLYKEVIDHMCIPFSDATAFRKRLAGYLIELNLKKKRYADAYCFYGLEKKVLPKLTLEEIQEKRRMERTEWSKNIAKNMTFFETKDLPSTNEDKK